MASLRARLAVTPAGYTLTRGRVLAVYGTLSVTLLLAALDQTIVVTALPRIVTDLGGLNSYAWVVTAYLLAMTVTVPLYGKLGDVYGRRPMFLGALTLFVAGSALCGFASGMLELVLYRALQGIGAGGLVPLALATLATTVPPRDRGRYTGFAAAAFGTAAIAGPALGGLIVDGPGWRWIFYLHVPLGAAVLAAVYVTMPRDHERLPHSIDYLGAALLAAGTGAMLLGLIWGGRDYPWTSGEVVGALAAGAALLAVFGLVERRVREPILPFALLRERAVAVGVAAMALGGMAMFGAIVFVPLFVQEVLGTSATSAGVVLIPFMLSAVVASVASGQWLSRTGRYKTPAVAGALALLAGLLLVWRMDVHTTDGEVARNAAVTGVGVGLTMQILLLAVQNSAPLARMGSASALVHFARLIGGTLGVTIMGVIVSQELPVVPGAPADLPERLPPALRAELADALQPAFLAAVCIAAAMVVVLLAGMREVPLRRTLAGAGETAR